MRRLALALSFGLLWFAATLSPYTGIVIPVDALVAEGWMYIPMMGLFLGAAQAATGLFEKKQDAARLLVLALAFSLSTATFLQNRVWEQHLETVYQNTVQDLEPGERLYVMGLFYLQQGDFDEAIEQFQRGIDHPGDRTNTQLASTHMWLAMAWLHVDVKEDNITMESLLRALPSSPLYP